MSLKDWERNGWLIAHRTSAHEIRDLLRVVDRDLDDSGTESLSSDWRMNIAYNAALQAAGAALAASGYRASRDQHHFRVIQSLRETLGTDVSVVNTLDAFRKKRNITGYERVGSCPTPMRRPCARWLCGSGTRSSSGWENSTRS